jgi:hypothetical protein
MNVHWKKSTNESKEKPKQKFDAAYGTILRISKCFQRRNQKRLKILKSFAHVQKVYLSESTDLIA